MYAGEGEKEEDYARNLPPHLLSQALRPALEQGKGAVVLAEEWQTPRAVIALDRLLRDAGLRERVTVFWNANSTFGFEGIEWATLRSAARTTTVSRYMKHRMRDRGIDALAIPNGLSAEAFEAVDPREFIGLYQRLRSYPVDEQRLRQLGRSTARRFAWSEVIERVLLPRVELERVALLGPRRARRLPPALQPYSIRSADGVPSRPRGSPTTRADLGGSRRGKRG